MAWARIRGLPQDRADFLSAQVCAVLANIHRAPDSKVWETAEFLPQSRTDEVFEEQEEPEPIEVIDIAQASKQLAALLGRKEER